MCYIIIYIMIVVNMVIMKVRERFVFFIKSGSLVFGGIERVLFGFFGL